MGAKRNLPKRSSKNKVAENQEGTGTLTNLSNWVEKGSSTAPSHLASPRMSVLKPSQVLNLYRKWAMSLYNTGVAEGNEYWGDPKI